MNTADYCFKNIAVKCNLVTQYAFKVLFNLAGLKSSISRECFKQLELTKLISNRIFESLNHLECIATNLEKREYLYELLGKCFLSDHVDDYIVNSHWIIDNIFKSHGNEQNVSQQVSFDNLGCALQSAERPHRDIEGYSYI